MNQQKISGFARNHDGFLLQCENQNNAVATGISEYKYEIFSWETRWYNNIACDEVREDWLLSRLHAKSCVCVLSVHVW